MEKPVLVIMAAGMGSRYGGLKQIDPIDQQGHIIVDFSIYDALLAGFEEVVFIIKRQNEADFRERIGDRIQKYIKVTYIYKDLVLPEGFSVPEQRVKPFGTGHAILGCLGTVKGPFAVINADDFYGKQAYKEAYGYLTRNSEHSERELCMVGFILKNTLSENGAVTRGLCQAGPDGMLEKVVETRNIEKTEGGAVVRSEDGDKTLDADCLVSMNMWGMQPGFFSILEFGFLEFLDKLEDGEPKAEYLLPTIIGGLLEEGRVTVKVLQSSDQWFGVTYKEDKESVAASVRKLVEDGVYPEKLF